MAFELDETHEDFRASVRAFTDQRVRPVVDEAERAGRPPERLWKEMGDAGLLGLLTPPEFGGSAGEGGESLAIALLSEELSRACGGIAVSALVSAYMAGPHIVRYGTPEQQQHWVPALAGGTAIAAIAVTEPGAGSDVAGITAKARHTDEGWVIDGRKMFITNAGLADVDRRRRQDLPRRRAPRDHHVRGPRRHARASRSARRCRRWAGTPRTPAR